MKRVSSIFSQILQSFSRLEFDAVVKEHKGERHARGFQCWTQFVSMLFCHLGHARSLSEITGGLAACEGKLVHLGVKTPPKKSTLAYANQHRPWEIYRDMFEKLYERCADEAMHRAKRKFRFRNKLLSLDASIIPLCIKTFDWAKYRTGKGAAKLHMLLDHDGYLPKFAALTEGKTGDITVARQLEFQKGTVVVFDKGYADYDWWLRLTRQGVYFVTRLKDDASYGVVRQREVKAGGNIIRDEEILLTKIQEEGPEAIMRRIEIWVEEKQKTMVFVTNNMKLAASTIAAIYKDRWAIEAFFKALKQSLRIKTFVGTSENAVLIQIWTALIAMLVVKFLQLKSTFGWSLSTLVALLRQQLFVYRDLWNWINQPFQAPPALEDGAAEQLQLFAQGGRQLGQHKVAEATATS